MKARYLVISAAWLAGGSFCSLHAGDKSNRQSGATTVVPIADAARYIYGGTPPEPPQTHEDQASIAPAEQTMDPIYPRDEASPPLTRENVAGQHELTENDDTKKPAEEESKQEESLRQQLQQLVNSPEAQPQHQAEETTTAKGSDTEQAPHDHGPLAASQPAATPGDDAKKQVKEDKKQEEEMDQQAAQQQAQLQQQAQQMADSAVANAPASESAAGSAMVSGNSAAVNTVPTIRPPRGSIDQMVQSAQDLGPDSSDKTHHSMDSLF